MTNTALEKVAQNTVLSAANTGSNVVKTTEVASETGLQGVKLASDTGLKAGELGATSGLEAGKLGATTGLKAGELASKVGLDAAAKAGNIGTRAMTNIGNTAVEGSTEIAKTSFEKSNIIAQESFGIAIDLIKVIRGTINYIPNSFIKINDSKNVKKYIEKYGVDNNIRNKIKEYYTNIIVKNSLNILTKLKDNLGRGINLIYTTYRNKIKCYYQEDGLFRGFNKRCDTDEIKKIKDCLNTLEKVKIDLHP